MQTRSKKIAAVAVVALAAAGIAFAAGQRAVDNPKRAASSQTTTTTTTTSIPSTPVTEGLEEFRDEKVGFAISYPRNWLRLQSSDPSVVLVVSEKPVDQNNGGSLLGRAVPLGAVVSQEQLADAKKLTDEIVTKGAGVELKFEPRAISQGGLPGWHYLYTFADQSSGQRGFHSHYFLFKDQTMISFVFQALPDTEFARLGGVFDDVIATFRVL